MYIKISEQFASWFLELPESPSAQIMQIVAIYDHYAGIAQHLIPEFESKLENLYKVLHEKPAKTVNACLLAINQELLNRLAEDKKHLEYDVESSDYVVISDDIDRIIDANFKSNRTKG